MTMVLALVAVVLKKPASDGTGVEVPSGKGGRLQMVGTTLSRIWSFAANLRRLSLYLILLLLPFFANAGESSCEIQLLKAKANDLAEVGTGSRVRIRSGGVRTVDAYFLGQQGSNVYFFAAKDGRILRAPKAAVTWKIDGGGEIQMNTLQSILPIETQVGPKCAANALANCLTILDQLGAIRNSDAKVKIADRQALIELLDALMGSEVAENQIKAAHGISAYLLAGIQEDLRKSLLDDWGIANEDGSFLALKAHLRRGYPVLIDLPVDRAMRKVVDIVTGEEFEERSFVPQTGVEAAGKHSVVAVGIIERGWFTDPLVLVLDSAFGSFSVWKLSDIMRLRQLNLIRVGG